VVNNEKHVYSFAAGQYDPAPYYEHNTVFDMRWPLQEVDNFPFRIICLAIKGVDDTVGVATPQLDSLNGTYDIFNGSNRIRQRQSLLQRGYKDKIYYRVRVSLGR
jgi:hypothetical protein